MLHPCDFRNAEDWYSFWKWIGFYCFNRRCKCLYYILIWFSAINIVDYLFLSTICFNRGRLTWNSNASPKLNSYMLKRNIQSQHYSLNVKFTLILLALASYLTWFWTSNARHGFLHIVSIKRKYVYHFS